MNQLKNLLNALSPFKEKGWELININTIVLLGIIVIWIWFRYFIYPKTKSRQLLNSLPSIFTSLGLFGTFAAICSSLSVIDSENIKIGDLINELIPAFSTSIYGLIAALISTICNKVKYAKEDYKIENETGNKTPEEHLFDISQNIVGQRKQISQMIALLTNQNDSYEQYNQQTTQNFAQIIALLTYQNDSYEQYNQQMAENFVNQNETLQTFINEFIGRMDSIFKDLKGNMEKAIKTIGEGVNQKNIDIIVELSKKLSKVSEELMLQNSESMKDIMDNTSKILNEILKKIEIGTEQHTESMRTSFEKIEQILNDVQPEIIKNQKEINGEFVENMTNTNSQIVTSMQDLFKTLTDTVAQQCIALSSAIEKNVSKLKEDYDFIGEKIATIKEGYEQAVESYRETVNSVQENNKTSENTIKEIDHSIKSLVVTNESIEKVFKLLDNRQVKIENLISHINRIEEAIDTLQALESTLNKIANK